MKALVASLGLALACVVPASLAFAATAEKPATAAKPAMAKPAMAKPGHAEFNGIWAGNQGVLWDVGAKPGTPSRAPYTPKYAAIYQEALDASARGKPKADPPAACLPPGVPRIVASPFPFEFIVTPHIVYILYEYMSQNRRVFMDNNAPPSLGEPSYNGRSTGRWEGSTLVIESTELLASTVLDTTQVPHSDKLRSVERYHLSDADTLELEITLHDPEAYTKPWTVKRTYSRKPEDQILEYVCAENNRNPVQADGTTGFIDAK